MILFISEVDDLVMYYYDEDKTLRCWVGFGEGIDFKPRPAFQTLDSIRSVLKYRKIEILCDDGEP